MAFGLSSFGYNSSSGSSGSEIWGPQASFLTNIYDQAGKFFDEPNPYLDTALSTGENAIGGITPYTNMALPNWANLASGGSFGGMDFNPSAINDIATGRGAPFGTYNDLMNPEGNPYLAATAQSGLGEMFRNFNRNIMPSITNNADMSGGLGGSRQGIAEGLAIDDLNTTGKDFLTGLYGGAYSDDQNRRLSSANNYLTNQTRALDLMRMFGQGSDLTTANAINYGADAVNLGFTEPNLYNSLYGMQWQPYSNAAAVAGSPVALGYEDNESQGFSLGF